MVAQHYRWDFIGLSTDTKPTPQTSEKVVDGSTFYCSDTSKLYVYCKDDWYERKPLGEGGGGTTYTAGDGINITDNTISVDTTTIQPKLTAGTGIDITDNTISATGGGATGEAKELTSADYDYPTDTPTGVALWLLPAGIYWTKQGVKVFFNTYTSENYEQTIIISNSDYNAYTDIIRIYSAGGKGTYRAYKTEKSTGSAQSTYSNKDFLLSDRITQDTGSETDLVLSQNAVSSLLFDDTSTRQKIKIGSLAASNASYSIGIGASSIANQNESIAIGHNTQSKGAYSIAIGGNSGMTTQSSVALGWGAEVTNDNSVAIGRAAKATRAGEVNIGSVTTNYGYNNTNYRVLGGVHDGQDAHDAATVAQGNTLATSAPTTSTVGVLGQLYTDTTNMHTYQCTAISGDTYTWTQRW